MIITKMQREPEGYLTARVTPEPGAKTVPVHRKFGSWMVDVPGSPGHMREVTRPVAAALQDKARLFEKHEAAVAEEVAA